MSKLLQIKSQHLEKRLNSNERDRKCHYVMYEPSGARQTALIRRRLAFWLVTTATGLPSTLTSQTCVSNHFSPLHTHHKLGHWTVARPIYALFFAALVIILHIRGLKFWTNIPKSEFLTHKRAHRTLHYIHLHTFIQNVCLENGREEVVGKIVHSSSSAISQWLHAMYLF